MKETIPFKHIPVMASQATEYLHIKPNGLYIDATLGGGGHSKEILLKNKTIKIIGIDQDEDALKTAKGNLMNYADRITFIHDNFSNIKNIIGNNKMDGILFDLGVSSYQIDEPDRGFSFQSEGPLDMRMGKNLRVTAQDLINSADRETLENIINNFGEERYYKRIVSSIIKKRPVKSTAEFSDIIKYSIPKKSHQNTVSSIARVFQAFRIAVNRELESLEKALNDSIDLLAPKGRIVVISYHSLEDRTVKNIFKRESTDCVCPPKLPACVCNHKRKLNIITRKPETPTEDEIRENPRSRSAKLRAAEHI